MDGDTMPEGQIDPVSAFVGELKADIRNILTGQTTDRESAAEYRHQMRNEIAKVGGRLGIVEHQIGEIVPQVDDLMKKDQKKQAVKEYSNWLLGMLWGGVAGVLSAAGGVAYNYFKAKGVIP